MSISTENEVGKTIEELFYGDATINTQPEIAQHQKEFGRFSDETLVTILKGSPATIASAMKYTSDVKQLELLTDAIIDSQDLYRLAIILDRIPISQKKLRSKVIATVLEYEQNSSADRMIDLILDQDSIKTGTFSSLNATKIRHKLVDQIMNMKRFANSGKYKAMKALKYASSEQEKKVLAYLTEEFEDFSDYTDCRVFYDGSFRLNKDFLAQSPERQQRAVNTLIHQIVKVPREKAAEVFARGMHKLFLALHYAEPQDRFRVLDLISAVYENLPADKSINLHPFIDRSYNQPFVILSDEDKQEVLARFTCVLPEHLLENFLTTDKNDYSKSDNMGGACEIFGLITELESKQRMLKVFQLYFEHFGSEIQI